MWLNPLAGSWARRCLSRRVERIRLGQPLAAVLLVTAFTLGASAELETKPATTAAVVQASLGPTVTAANPSSTATSSNNAAATGSATSASAPSATPNVAAGPPTPTWRERLVRVWSGAVGLVFDKWTSPLFEANFWNTSLAGVRVVLPLLFASLLIAAWVVERGHGRVPAKLVRQLSLTLTVAGFLVHYGGFNPNVRHPGFYQPQAFYHGYLGQKYADELSATSLVECTVAAEKELGKAQTHTQRYVYPSSDAVAPVLASTLPGASNPRVCSEHFSAERWQSFRTDIEWFLAAVKAEEWALLQRTRPEVSTPAWRLIVSPLVQTPASQGRFRGLAFVEPLLHAVALGAVVWGFGPVAGALVSVTWGCQPFFAFTGGAALLGNLWLVAWLVGLSVWRRRAGAKVVRPVVAGVLMALGACLQPLSALALLPLGASFLSQMRTGVPSSLRKLAIALGATAIVVGLISGRGGSYGLYAEDVAHRRATPALSDVGLPALLANHGTARYRFQRIDTSPDPTTEWSALRGPAQERKTVWQRVAMAMLLGLAGYLAWKRRSVETAALVGLSLAALSTQPVTQDLGLIALALLCSRRADLALPLLTALAGCVALANQTAFADDRAAALTALLWVTTMAILLAWTWPWLGKLGSSSTTVKAPAEPTTH